MFAKFYHGQQPGWQNYYNPPTVVPALAVPIQQPPPPRTLSDISPERAIVNQIIAVRQPPPQREAPVYNAPEPQPHAEQNQTGTARYDFVRKIVEALQVRSQ